MKRTFGSILKENNGFGPGFDFMRVALAFSILAYHSWITTGREAQIEGSAFWFSRYALVPMFFSLSGFLIAGSGLRLSLQNFLTNRGLRILPALAVEVVFAALILGPIFTTLALSDYFTDRVFFEYFANMVGLVRLDLPGVFKTNPTDMVNGSLWTIPYELMCYAIISALIFTRLLGKVWAVIAATILTYVVCSAGVILGLDKTFPGAISWIVSHLFYDGAVLFPCFLLGILGYLLRDRIAYDFRIFALAVAVCLVAAFTGETSWVGKPIVHPILVPALAYITIFLGVTKIPRLPFFWRGDYSYGIYLYHMPFEQALLAIAPAFFIHNPLVHLAASALLVTGVAFLSWTYIEKPILDQRKRFSFAHRVREAEVAAEATDQPAAVAKVPVPEN